VLMVLVMKTWQAGVPTTAVTVTPNAG